MAAGEIRAVTFRTRTMGTIGSLTLVTADSVSVADLAYEALLSFHHTDSLMTNWTRTSETARINRLAGSEVVVLNPEINQVLGVAGRVWEASGGAFDITVEPLVRLWGFLEGNPHVPQQDAITAALARVGWEQIDHDSQSGTIRFLHPATRIDLGGIAKGYGVDQVVDILRASGVANALVDLSGNMFAVGEGPAGRGWSLGIMDPEKQHEYLGRLLLKDEVLATSGNYLQYVMNPGSQDDKRYGHILDPRTGWPAEGMASATVVASNAADADAWATAFIVMETGQALRVAEERRDLKVVLIEQAADHLQVIWVEEALRRNFMIKEGLEETVEVKYF